MDAAQHDDWSLAWPLQRLPREELRANFERVVGIAYSQVLALSVVLIGVISLTTLPIGRAGVVAVLVGLHGLNLACLYMARRGDRMPFKIYLHVVASVALMTALIHFI